MPGFEDFSGIFSLMVMWHTHVMIPDCWKDLCRSKHFYVWSSQSIKVYFPTKWNYILLLYKSLYKQSLIFHMDSQVEHASTRENHLPRKDATLDGKNIMTKPEQFFLAVASVVSPRGRWFLCALMCSPTRFIPEKNDTSHSVTSHVVFLDDWCKSDSFHQWSWASAHSGTVERYWAVLSRSGRHKKLC